MLHVPYKGTGQAVTDLLAGQIDVMFARRKASCAHVQAGRLKALAVTSAKRSATLPELPTAAESACPATSHRLVRIACTRGHAQGDRRPAVRG
jgi:tripartite-type tricarboxylate transporter receptor subunit TctC